MYSGKFNTASRRKANVKVSGNSVYVSESSFKTYANYKNFWIFSNDEGKGNKVATSLDSTSNKSYTRYVSTESKNLNVRKSDSINSKIVGSLKNGTKVTVTATSGNWSKIKSPNGWVSTSYLSSKKQPTVSSAFNNTVGQYKRLKSKTTLYSKSDLSGNKYNYLALTQVKIIKNVSSKVDYVYVVKTGRYAYVRNNVYK